MKEEFIQAIHNTKKILVDFYSKEDGLVITRTCAPMDYGPSKRKNVEKNDRYHMWDYDSDRGTHVLSLSPEQIKNIQVLDSAFDPKEFVTWTPSWIIPRNWGQCS